jgi:hypothetical protein
MATPKTRTVDKSSTLATLNQLVAQQEQILGPLIAISNDGNQTVLVFDAALDPPVKNAVLAAAAGASGGTPGGTHVARGEVFIAGAVTDTIATRPA